MMSAANSLSSVSTVALMAMSVRSDLSGFININTWGLSWSGLSKVASFQTVGSYCTLAVGVICQRVHLGTDGDGLVCANAMVDNNRSIAANLFISFSLASSSAPGVSS